MVQPIFGSIFCLLFCPFSYFAFYMCKHLAQHLAWNKVLFFFFPSFSTLLWLWPLLSTSGLLFYLITMGLNGFEKCVRAEWQPCFSSWPLGAHCMIPCGPQGPTWGVGVDSILTRIALGTRKEFIQLVCLNPGLRTGFYCHSLCFWILSPFERTCWAPGQTFLPRTHGTQIEGCYIFL